MAAHELRDKAVILDSARDCLKQADIVLVTTPDEEFRKLKYSDFESRRRPVLVFDFWRILRNELGGRSDIDYKMFGYGHETDSSAGFLEELWRLETEDAHRKTLHKEAK
jgi:hypothetical protein